MDYLHPHAAPFRFESHESDEVLFLHGWTGSPAHLRPLSRVIAEAGYPVTAPLLAGHGTTEADMADTTWRDWVRTAGEAAQGILDRGHRLHLAGLSMGGVISLLIAPTFGASSVTTINAPIKVHDWRVRFSGLMRGSKTIKELPEDDTSPEGTEEFWQSYQDRPVGTVADLFDLVRAVKRNLAAVESPALIIQSHADETVKPESGRLIYEGISSTDKRLLWLQRSRHVATLDAERHLIADAMLDLLETSASAG
jgi:carboxylesterase